MMNTNPFKLETTTIWSFPNRGDWATHSNSYRGNWSPYVPRNLILKYSKPNEWILDQFMGGGTTLIEAKLLNRNIIGTDININAFNLTKKNLNFSCNTKSHIHIRLCNAQNLDFIKDDSIALICTHPPYANIIRYSQNTQDDISLLSLRNFLIAIENVAKECYRILKHNRICAIMMGDIRQKGVFIPLGYKVMNIFLERGFNLKDIIIKEQHNCQSTQKWANKKNDFYLIAHEYIFIFQKKIKDV